MGEYSLIYTNIDIQELVIDGDIYRETETSYVKINHREIIQTLSQSTKNVIAVIDTTRGPDGDINPYFKQLLKIKDSDA